MILDHIGIVVRSLSKGIEQWEKLFGYNVSSNIVHNTRQNVLVVFLEKDESITIKLIQPADHDSPIFSFAKKGGGLHHLCFRCNNIKSQIPILVNNGARCIVPPQPGEAFDNHDIAFLLAGNNLNIELIDTNKKAGIVTDKIQQPILPTE